MAPINSVTSPPSSIPDSSLTSVDSRPVHPSLDTKVKVPTSGTGEAVGLMTVKENATKAPTLQQITCPPPQFQQ